MPAVRLLLWKWEAIQFGFWLVVTRESIESFVERGCQVSTKKKEEPLRHHQSQSLARPPKTKGMQCGKISMVHRLKIRIDQSRRRLKQE